MVYIIISMWEKFKAEMRPKVIPILSLAVSLTSFSCSEHNDDARQSEADAELMTRVVTVLQSDG